VFDLALDGRTTASIADQLVVSEATVRTHLTRIYSKLQVRGRLDLLARVGGGPSSAGQLRQVPESGIGLGRPVIWLAGALSAVGLVAAFFAPPVTVLLGPALVALGLFLRRRLPREHRWVRVLVLTVGSILCAEAVVIALFVFGLLALGTRGP
jgi:hypothetical protein